MAERDEWRDKSALYQAESTRLSHETRGDFRIIQWLIIASFSVAGAVLTAATHFSLQSAA